MSVVIDGYQFDGPYANINLLHDYAGVYVVLDNKGSMKSILDIGETSKVKASIKDPEHLTWWHEHAKGKITFAVLYTPNKQRVARQEIEQALRRLHNLSLGDDA